MIQFPMEPITLKACLMSFKAEWLSFEMYNNDDLIYAIVDIKPGSTNTETQYILYHNFGILKGSNLIERLRRDVNQNFRSGDKRYVEMIRNKENLEIVEYELMDLQFNKTPKVK